MVLLLLLISVGGWSVASAAGPEAGKTIFFGTLEACQTAEVGSFGYYEPRDLTRLPAWEARVARGEATREILSMDHCRWEATVVGRRIVRLRAGTPVFVVGGKTVADGRCGNELGEGVPVPPPAPPPTVEVAVVVVCKINCNPLPAPPPSSCDPCAPPFVVLPMVTSVTPWVPLPGPEEIHFTVEGGGRPPWRFVPCLGIIRAPRSVGRWALCGAVVGGGVGGALIGGGSAVAGSAGGLKPATAVLVGLVP